MTVSEWVYPGSAVVTLLVGAVFCWQWQKNLRQQALHISNDREAWEKAKQSWEKQRLETVVIESHPPEEVLYLQGKIHHLERDLRQLHALEQGQAEEVAQLHHDLRQRNVTILTLQKQVSHQEHHRQELSTEHQHQIKELRQENAVLSQRLQQEVIKQTQWRQQSLLVEPLQSRLQTLEALQIKWAEEKHTLETSYSAQITTLQENLSQQQEVGAQAQQQINQLQQDLARQALEQEQSRTIQGQLEKREQELCHLRQQYETLQEQGSQLERDKQLLQAQLETTQKDQAKVEQALQAQTELLQHQLQEQTEQIKSHLLTIEGLEKELHSSKDVPAVVEITPVELNPPEGVETIIPVEPNPPEVVENVVEPSSSAVVGNITETQPDRAEPLEVIIETQTPVLSPLAGKKFVIAGTLSHLNREETKVQIQAAGGSVTHSPSSKTDYVVVGKAPGEKLKKAQKLGVVQLSEAQFLKLLGLEL